MTIAEVQNHLTGMMHAGSALNKVRNLYYAMERAAARVNANIKTLDIERTTAMSSLIYDDIYNYSLPSDFGWAVDIYPQDDRTSADQASHRMIQQFDLQKAIKDKTVTIEGNDGTKFMRLNWRTNSPILIDDFNDTTGWSAVGTATGIAQQKLHKISGNASLEFDIAATGDGIQNTSLSTIDLSDEDEIADPSVWLNIPTAADLANLNSVTAIWGNDLDTNYWTATAETDQADGTAFKVGWNLLQFPWSAATETGTVAPATIDSFKLTFNVDAAISNLRVDSAYFNVGRNFDLKYYSKYAFKNSSGTYIQRPTTDTDEVVYTETALAIFLEECRKECAAQIEGSDSAFDINYANHSLYGDPSSPDPMLRRGLYAKYRAEYPSQTKKAVGSWSTIRNPNGF